MTNKSEDATCLYFKDNSFSQHFHILLNIPKSQYYFNLTEHVGNQTYLKQQKMKRETARVTRDTEQPAMQTEVMFWCICGQGQDTYEKYSVSLMLFFCVFFPNVLQRVFLNISVYINPKMCIISDCSDDLKTC